MTILVTGASGFVGSHVVDALLKNSIKVRVALRLSSKEMLPSNNLEVMRLSGMGIRASDWANVVSNCVAVIHLAALVRDFPAQNDDLNRAYQLANVDLARACAAAAVGAGVKHFVFLSSVGVHGGLSTDQPIQVDSAILPHTKYAYSKAQAEKALREVVLGSKTKLTVIRPPLVYGHGAGGNFDLMMRAISCGLPLPMSLLTSNLRSIVSIDNLVSLIVICLNNPAAADQTFLVSDGEDISTADLVRRLGSAMGKPSRLFPVPVSWLAWGAKLLGKPEMCQSLCGSMQVDIGKTRELLDWVPKVSIDEGLRRVVARSK